MDEFVVQATVRLKADDARQAAAVVRGALEQEELACEIGSVRPAGPWDHVRQGEEPAVAPV